MNNLVNSPSSRSVVSAVKASNQTFSTATPADVTDMSLAVLANEIWDVEILGRSVVDGTGSISVKIVVPTGATVTGFYNSANVSNGKLTENTTLSVTPGGASATDYFLIRMSVVVGSTAGTMSFQASEFSHGAGVQILANTYLKATKISPS